MICSERTEAVWYNEGSAALRARLSRLRPGREGYMMQESQPSAAETVRRGQALYDERIRPVVEPQNVGRYIAIDVDSAAYEIGDNYHSLAHEMLRRNPHASVCVLRIGYPAVGRIGGRRSHRAC